MIGIDVVDHSDPLLRPRNERSFRLISHPSDQHDATITTDLENLFWLYWAAKEAIYKANRLPIRFAPKQIPVSITQKNGSISILSNDIQGFIDQNNRSTLCICWNKAISSTPWYQLFESIEKDQSLEVRKQLILFLMEKGIEGEMSKDWKGLPVVNYNGKAHLTTFTHHHKLAAFICEQ
ncbi:4'-phosphopantetheinyl transferase superfamily protein [Marinoscillum sp. MHG1-6]|uniref:4'-phosphopantetheinyl transferase family protein n=1 Tax=Marinoscillum sp. MHG1-6 TaxID=2959627 RepID=UPI0021570A66|nr:4'-phosphopantetheinyl transferase superfamily protein [Marinoscillum sp. MHG1-6]